MAKPPQAQHHGKGLLTGEHERRQAKAGLQPVETADAAHGFNGHAQILKPGDVTLHGAQINLKPFSKFAAADMIASLKNFEHG